MFRELLTLRSLRQVFSMTPSALENLQIRKLRAAIGYAYTNVPFYRERFDQAGVRPDDIRTVDDLALLPQTTKRDLQTAEAHRVVASGVDPETCLIRRTNGSTGTPLRIFLTATDQQKRSLVELRSLIHLGVRLRDRTVCGAGNATPSSVSRAIGSLRQ